MVVIDSRDVGALVTDLSQWHSVFIWVPRFVLMSKGAENPSWKFVGIGEVMRRSIGSEEIGSRRIHRWVYKPA